MTTRPVEVGPFRREWFFLSNFYLCVVLFEGEEYPSVEHGFQASKTTDFALRHQIAAAETPGMAKRLGRSVPLRSDWEEVKDEVMLALLRSKFSEPYLSTLLRRTGRRRLVERNDWGDSYWGVCDGVGLNRLGTLLEKVRSEVQLWSKE